MQLQGVLTITVDEVDIEQIVLAKPALVKGLPSHMRAAVAARHHEDFVKIWRILQRHHQTLEYSGVDIVGTKKQVTFFARAKTREEMAA